MNERLYSITNRDTGFSSEAFPAPIGFIPDQNSEADALRSELRLTEGNDDYFTVGLLAAVRAFPVYYELLRERGSAVDVSKYVRPTTLHQGGTLTSGPGGPPSVVRVCRAWPVTFKVDLEYLADDAATIRYDGKTLTIACRKMEDRRIDPTWPEDCGVSGRVDLLNDWEVGNVYRIENYPVRFPYAALSAVASRSAEAQSLIAKAGLADAFYGGRSSIEKIALVAIALGRSNRRVYP